MIRTVSLVVAATFALAGGASSAVAAITANALTNNAITANAITANAITANAITANAITANGAGRNGVHAVRSGAAEPLAIAPAIASVRLADGTIVAVR